MTYIVCDGRAVTSKGKMLVAGDEVIAKNIVGGQKRIDDLVKAGVLESKKGRPAKKQTAAEKKEAAAAEKSAAEDAAAEEAAGDDKDAGTTDDATKDGAGSGEG